MATWILSFTPEGRPWEVDLLEAGVGLTRDPAPPDLISHIEAAYGSFDRGAAFPFQSVGSVQIQWPDPPGVNRSTERARLGLVQLTLEPDMWAWQGSTMSTTDPIGFRVAGLPTNEPAYVRRRNVRDWYLLYSPKADAIGALLFGAPDEARLALQDLLNHRSLDVTCDNCGRHLRVTSLLTTTESTDHPQRLECPCGRDLHPAIAGVRLSVTVVAGPR